MQYEYTKVVSKREFSESFSGLFRVKFLGLANIELFISHTACYNFRIHVLSTILDFSTFYIAYLTADTDPDVIATDMLSGSNQTVNNFLFLCV